MNSGRHGYLVGAAAAALVVSPALAATLSSGRALVNEAAAITAIVVALLGAGLALRGWRRVLATDRPTLLALSLYGAAAAQGAVVALARGNEATLIAGQFLAMALLPLGAVAALGLLPPGGWRPFATGFVAAAGAGGFVQLVMTVPAAIDGPPGVRLLPAHGESFAGAAPLALFLAFALTRAGRAWARALAWAAGTVMLVLILGTGIRSQWLVLPAGIAAYALLAAGRERLLSRRTIAIAGPILLVLVAGGAAATWWWLKPRPSLLPAASTPAVVKAGEPILLPLPGTAPGVIRIRAVLTCQRAGYVSLVALQRPAPGGAGPGVARPFGVSGVVASDVAMVVALRPGTTDLALELADPQRLACTASRLRVEALWPPVLARFGDRVAASLERPPDPGAGPTAETFAQDASIAFRLREARAISQEIRHSGWPLRILGHGLGATYSIDTLGYDGRGRVQRFNRPNYIHNFYLFLPFKLGLLGSVEVLVALGLFVWVAAEGARGRPACAPDRHFFAAAAASWITYILWSAAAPEILDFRLAAIWGMLAATTASARESADPGPSQV